MNMKRKEGMSRSGIQDDYGSGTRPVPVIGIQYLPLEPSNRDTDTELFQAKTKNVCECIRK